MPIDGWPTQIPLFLPKNRVFPETDDSWNHIPLYLDLDNNASMRRKGSTLPPNAHNSERDRETEPDLGEMKTLAESERPECGLLLSGLGVNVVKGPRPRGVCHGIVVKEI
jgi:hypothetical protein